MPDPHAANAPDAGSPDARAARLAALRARIRRLERGGAGPAAVLPLGPAAIDSALPGGGLPLACLHEIAVGADGEPAGAATRGPAGPAGGAGALAGGAAAGFAAAIAARLAVRCGRPVLWLMRDGDLYPPGLVRYGLVPERLVLARAARQADRLWALEEAARSGALAAVVGEAAAAGPSESRRLQLAAEAGGVTVILLDRDGDAGRAGRRAAGTAVTRWRVAAAAGAPDGPGVGVERWRLELVRARGGRPGAWLVAWHDPAPSEPAGRPGELALVAAEEGAVPAPRRQAVA